MLKIYKYPLQVVDEQVIEMPHNAVPLCVQVQNGVPCLWVNVDPERVNKKRFVQTYGTGRSYDEAECGNYVGTYQLGGGALVYHVFMY